MKEENKISLLVISCDRYADLWSPFFAFFKKFWPDCPYKVYLSTNHLDFNSEGVTVLKSKKVADWSSELATVLRQIDSEYVMVFLEDYFLRKKVNTRFIDDALQLVIARNAAFMKITCFPSKYNQLWPYQKLSNDNRFAVIKNGAKYQVNLQVGLWNKSYLENILRENESPWQFETEASKRAAMLDAECLCVVENPFNLHVHGPVTHLCGAVTRGVLMREAIRMGRKYNVLVNKQARPVESVFEEFKRRIRIAMPMIVRHGIDYLGSRLKQIH